MAGLQEQPRWENEVYRIEENDPVHGGENGITNKPIKQLANRTKYLKQELEKPATTEQVGRVQLDSSTSSTSETKAATPKAVKTVKDLADSNARSLQNVIPNSKKSNSVSSTSSDTVATSYAVKQAYDKGVSAQNTADSANNNANGRVSKSGDVMTGILTINHQNAHVLGKRDGRNAWFAGLPNETSEDAVFHSYAHGTSIRLSADRAEVNKTLYVGDNQALLDKDFTGSIAFFATNSAPNGWLKANGAAVSRTTYAALFSRIGTTFGAGDGQTTFNLPDLRGEFIRGWDDGRNVDGGRRFGEAQQGSLTTIDLSPDEQGTSIHGLSMRKLNNINTPKDLAKMAGFDLTNANDVNHFYQLWVKKDGNRYVDSQLATVAISNSSGSVGNGHINGFTRPRNIALLACIKY